MLRVNYDENVRADSTLSACIRSLPLAVLHLFHSGLNSPMQMANEKFLLMNIK